MAAFSKLGAWLYGSFARNPKSNQIVVEFADLHHTDRVLEVGCGAGAALELAAAITGPEGVAAVDPTPRFVETTLKRVPGADVRVAAAESLPFDDATFTVIWSIASMHHWGSREAGLTECVAKLAPGGRLLIAEQLLSKPGHGITDPQTTEVVAFLKGLDVASVDTAELAAGRKTMRVIRARKTPAPG